VNKPGKKCPECGAEGKAWHGEHETAVRNYKLPNQTIADVGWRCWHCGHEWGFEVDKVLGKEEV
jgi:predicted HNH restriction endonuclease